MVRATRARLRATFGTLGPLWIGLLAAGFAGGVACDPVPPRAPERAHRAGYRVLEADFHAHTTFSDGSLTPFGLVRQAERRGLDVLALTEHNSVYPGRLARAYASLRGGPMILAGEEITTSSFHVIGVGLSKTVTANQPIAGVIADIHAQGGIAIAAHPVAHFWPKLLPVRGDFDGAEVMHPIAYSSRGGWRWADMVTFYEESNPKLAAIGSSDYHWGSILGLCRTLLFVDEPANEASVMAALRARRTVVIANDGRTFGDPAMIAALEHEPYVTRTADYAYHGEGSADRVLRTMGWLGLVGMVVFGRRKRDAEKLEALVASEASGGANKKVRDA